MKQLRAWLRGRTRMQIATIVCIGVVAGAALGIAGQPLIGLLFFGGSAMAFNITTKE